MSFKDHFSGHAEDYRQFRPDYPPALFEFLAANTKSRERAWDCGTGSGQAARSLAVHFRHVIATDASAAQIQNALRHPRVDYRTAPAEHSDIEPTSIDLITVAQALHWFDLEGFYGEVHRVLKPNGLLAVWCYGLSRIAPAIDEIVTHYYTDIVGPYWPAERHFIDAEYQSLSFPFDELPPPSLCMQAKWNLEALLGYLSTWSAAKRYRQQRGRDPLDEIRTTLCRAWGPAGVERTVTWPIHLRVGRITAGKSYHE